MEKLKSKITGATRYLYHHHKVQGIYMVKSGKHYDAAIWTYTKAEFKKQYSRQSDSK